MHIARHGYIDVTVGVVPGEGEAKVFGAGEVEGDNVEGAQSSK